MARAAARSAVSEGAVVTKAALRAAGLLGVSNKVLGRIIGLSEASVSRMGSGAYTLTPGEKPFELANPNAALGTPPLTLIQSVSGLVDAVAYLDARRALV